MSIFVNSSRKLYPRVFVSGTLEAELAGEARGHARSLNGLDLRARFAGEISGHARLALITPDPILNEIAEDAFQSQHYTARLLDNDNDEINIASFSIDSPRGSIGKLVQLVIAEKDLSLITTAKKYTFQIGIRPTARGAAVWHTIIENAVLDSRSFSLAWGQNTPNDTLAFGAVNPLHDKLNRCPIENIIIFDPSKTSVSVQDLERIFDTNGQLVDTELISVRGLSLYYLFKFLKKITGLNSIRTNIPNFELTRIDLPFTQSFRASIAGIVGVFDPLFFAVGTELWILDKTAAIPEDFAPRAVTVDEFINWQMQMPSGPALDGLLLSYIDSNMQANTYADRLVQSIEETGRYGDADYTRTEIARTYRDWKNTADLNVVLKSDIIREVHSKYNNLLELIGRETETHAFDTQGKRTNSSRKVESLVPNFDAAGAAALLTTKQEFQSIFYTPEPRNSRRFLQSKVITQVRGLIAVDTVNTYLDKTGSQAPFKQDFERMHEAGNLTLEMTTEFGPIQTVTETLTPLGNNQYQVRVSTLDHLRDKPKNSVSEPKTGDASLNAVTGRTRQLLVLRDGLTQSTRTGLPVEPFAVGELPLVFARPLAERVLARRLAKKQSGAIEIAGFDPSVERGVFFTVLHRNGSPIGKFLAEGFSVTGSDLGTPKQRIVTRIDAAEI